eukprot:scaffold1037_cov157-Amphora_coffeaeformis.AAC.4
MHSAIVTYINIQSRKGSRSLPLDMGFHGPKCGAFAEAVRVESDGNIGLAGSGQNLTQQAK